MTVPHSPPEPKPTSLPMPSTSLFADIDGVSVHHTLTPAKLVPPLLICIHGFGASLFSFSFLTMLPSRINATLLSFDLPGFGLTSRPHSLSCYVPRFGERIVNALANAYTPNRSFALLAHSMGSLSAVRTALSTPERVSAMVLVAPALVSATPLPRAMRLFARAGAGLLAWFAVGVSFVLGPALALVLRKYVGSKSFWRTGLALAREGPVPDDVVEGYFAPTSTKAWDRGVLNFTRAALIDRARALGEGEDFVGMLAKEADRPPLLIIHGENDRVVPLSNSKRLVECLPGAKLVIMKGCGHVPHEERPDDFSRIVAEFLENTNTFKESV